MKNEEFLTGENDFKNVKESLKIEFEKISIEENKNLINEGKEEKEWKEELALAA